MAKTPTTKQILKKARYYQLILELHLIKLTDSLFELGESVESLAKHDRTHS